MSCSYCTNQIEQYGADPAKIQWSVVRGDTSTIQVQFLENDEVTFLDTSNWTYTSTAYDPVTKISYDLDVFDGEGFINITASPEQTDTWGTGYRPLVSELSFDVQVTRTTDNVIWTPVTGTICVLGDTTRGGSL